MEEKFKFWMIRSEGKLESTAINYSRAIHSLSEHYSSFTGTPTDIYSEDLEQLVQIKNCYESNGRFSEVGHFRHGLNRAAIKAFYRFKLAHPEMPITKKKNTSAKFPLKREKHTLKSFTKRLLAFYTSLFRKQKSQKVPSGYIVGTKGKILKRLLPLAPIWEKEVHEKYFIENPRCEHCKSMEFVKVVEKHPLNPNNLLKTILSGFAENKKQSVLISDLEVKYKNKFTQNGNRLIVLCRTCNQKEEERKVERFRHEVPPIMRKDPPELRY